MLFVGSGGAALIYEIVWFQVLQLVIGSSAVSLGVVLGTFMGGMCIGSLALPRVISSQPHPLKVYVMLELGIGILGLIVLVGMPSVGGLYVASVGLGLPGFLLRGVVCAVCLLPPTLLMGATLPAISRWVETTPQGVSWLGFFYVANILGAVCGCVAAGFYLLRVHDAATATYIAVATNLSVAALAFVLARREPYQPASMDSQPAEAAPGSWTVYIAIAISGACALAAQVIWTRLLSLLLGGTVYTFSIIVGVFLAGLGLGGGVGAVLSRGRVRPRLALGVCQLLLTAAMAWAAFMMTQSLPYWPINPMLSTSPWFAFQIDLVRCLWAILPAACLWGASFPLALAAAASPGQDPGRLVSGVYAANTIGAVIGALAATLLLIPWLGTQQAQQLLVALSAAGGLLVLSPLARRRRSGKATASAQTERPLGIGGGVAVMAAAAVAAWLVISIPAVPRLLVAYGRYMVTWLGHADVLYVGEGMNSSVAVSREDDAIRFHVSGKVEASNQPQDMRLQRMLAHLPALVHANPSSVLVVGLGAGVTAGSFIPYPSLRTLVISEIEPLIPKVIAGYFTRENNAVVSDPRVTVVYDDARHYILTTRETFDIITSDPIHPWVKGSATLYTKEYFKLVKQRLNPGGVVTQWVPLYESDSDAVKMIVATFLEVFPRGTAWSAARGPGAIDVLLMGQTQGTRIDVDALEERLGRADFSAVAASLREVGFATAIDLLRTYAGQGPDLGAWLMGAEINRDRNLRLQYLAGLELNSYQSERIHNEIVAYRRFPSELFVASGRLKEALSGAAARPAWAP